MTRFIAVLFAGAVAASSMLSSGCAAPTTDTNDTTKTAAAPLSGSDAVARAQEWVNAGLLYCGAPYGHYDSAICGYECNRQENPAWDAYRSDCSGLVSWSWGLPAPGNTTLGFAPFNGSASYVINASELQPGDAVNSTDHIMLFKGWINFGSTAAFLEEYTCGAPAHELDIGVSINGTTLVRNDWQSNPFTAIRFSGIDNVNPDGCTAEQDQACGNFACACVAGQCSGGFCPGGGCSATENNNAAAFGCQCVDHQASGGFCDGSGCTVKETSDAADFACACVDHKASGGFCDGTGCTAKETNDAAKFGCACVDHKANGGFCDGTGCTVKETEDAAKFGCACVDHKGDGGYCAGTGCTVKETEDAAKFGCACVDHKGDGGFCPGTGCTALETEDAAKFGCGCVDHKGNGGACPGTGCTAGETKACSAKGQTCSMHKCL